MFVSSSTGGPNDLGMHAGMVMKFILLLWATPWILETWTRRRELMHVPLSQQAFVAGAVAAFAIGLGGAVYQIATERALFPLREEGILKKKMDVFPVADLSRRLYDVRDAYRAAASLLPEGVRVAFDPDSPLQPALDEYATVQITAGDKKCGTPFGGDAALCTLMYPSLLAPFGSPQDDSVSHAGPAAADGTSVDALCERLAIGAMLVTSSDPVWGEQQSWVWQRSPLYSNDSVRLFACAKR